MSDVVIVGAGPAGLRAAEILCAAGLRPIVLDENPRPGGQIYRQQPAGFSRPYEKLYGSEAAKARALHDLAGRLAIDHRPGTQVWNLRPGVLYTEGAGRFAEVPFAHVILATGAMDRVIPLPGWTLPGVYSLGGAQIALKAQATTIGSRVAFIGTGPLLWLCAAQYRAAGATVAAIIDTTGFTTKARATPGMLRNWGTFSKGLKLVASLRIAGVPCFEGATPRAIEGTDAPTSVRFTHKGSERQIACDAVAIGYGLKPEAQLADLAGVPFVFDPVTHNFAPARDAAGHTSVAGVYLAGDGAGIAGADAAELSGARAAWSVLQDRGAAVDAAAIAALDARIAAMARFREALEAAFPFPAHLAAAIPDSTILCRCEAITAGEYRRIAEAGPAPELNRAKALSRVGMGRCQGRVCGPAAAEVLAAALKVPVSEVGRLRGQPPVKPIPMFAEAAE
jgi:NADPH-dependent 2,4-dienoyl-CoA reductase/sulfur reductase-like enzyme